ncbi:MAG TPA: bifunctional [glutamine synthetase] adenylyltransferase/[glutamine synthetase]-adenylyl-L-tyrosine phosphorylase, partial [Devosia sp.]|nr:bifunctional [glutamine synthetase] adenylyltransferase/[glutamine synthetase]-adenylyl-L-tyrosine phosphorylase [Devosia sp.]
MIEQFVPLPQVLPSDRFDQWQGELSPPDGERVNAARPVLAPLFAAAPYLADLAQKHAGFLVSALFASPRETLDGILSQEATAGQTAATLDDISQALRRAKSRAALLIAVAETGGVWTPRQAAMALSDLADTCLSAGLSFLVREAVSAKRFRSVSDGDRQPVDAANCGLAIIALGKHGGRELNYSSDIDIVAFFDPAAGVLTDSENASRTYTRLVQRLASLMQERTEHGYVFRTDLRLRPDPGSTPVALSVDAALTYYEGRGQNWERAAWIKARQAAGDGAVGARFLADLSPFIWRKHLDFATIADIQAMKRQINMATNTDVTRLAGHNVKLGQGGIREIEFFAQTQQLIAGGREPELRVIPTQTALERLAESGWITRQSADDLTRCYWFLRAVENRIQMRNDEQTHKLPDSAEALLAIAVLMGFESIPEFERKYRAALAVVSENYANLFVRQSDLATRSGSLVFTGTDDDPATLENLSGMGFADPQRASALIRKWHYGGYAATRAAASRAHLTELVPLLLQTLGRTGNADQALQRFDDFVSRLPAGVQLFAMLRTRPELCQLLVAFMASAARMAEEVIRRAHVLDGMIDPARTGEVMSPQKMRQKVETFLREATDFEDLIDRARIIGQEQKFLVSAGLISGTISADRAAVQFANIAQTLLQVLFDRVRAEFAARHGVIEGAEVGLLAFGRLASRQMSATSDLDVILLYRTPQDATCSNGERPLDKTPYFARLTQRLVAALSARTAQGVLYEIDMRLRPSGNAGPLATSLDGFEAYQMEKAWTSEHQALTRARPVYGSKGFCQQVEASIDRILGRKRSASAILRDVKDMRQRLLRERPPRHDWDLKLVDGGLTD